MSHFLYLGCQIGAEGAAKRWLAREHPELRFSFSRPGFLTFKTAGDMELADGFEPRCPLARVWGLAHGRAQGESPEVLAESFWRQAPERVDQLHVWPRRPPLAAEDHPANPAAIEQTRRAVLALRAAPGARPLPVNQVAEHGESVLDCVLVDPELWWVGRRRADTPTLRWPGGVPPLEAPQDMISRAYLKVREALLWSRLPVEAGDTCLEIGSAPGGACQALLELGLEVWGVDPAEMDPRVAEHPRFRHLRKRGAELRRRDLGPIRWLLADSNVAPAHTLDTVEAIVTHAAVRVEGMLLTLKLPNWEVLDELPLHLARIRRWGFATVEARQLAYNGQELCVRALRR